MNDNNIFGDLTEQKIKEIGEVPANVKRDLHGSIHFIHLFSSCVELYGTQLMNAATLILGVEEHEKVIDVTGFDDSELD